MADEIKKIILGSIPDDFDPSKHIPIGSFCFVEREDVYSDWENLNFEPDPFATPDQLKAADRNTCDYALWLSNKMGQDYNKEFGLNYGREFWKIMLFPLIGLCVQSTWERQKRVHNIISKYKDEKIEIDLVKDNIEWNFVDGRDYMSRGIWSPFFNEWLFSRIIEHQLPKNWICRYIDKKGKECPRTVDDKKGVPLKNILRQFKNKFFSSLI